MSLSSTLNKTTVFITRDLDEAIRMGDRIGIMKDGEIVQIGTAEDIVTEQQMIMLLILLPEYPG